MIQPILNIFVNFIGVSTLNVVVNLISMRFCLDKNVDFFINIGSQILSDFVLSLVLPYGLFTLFGTIGILGKIWIVAKINEHILLRRDVRLEIQGDFFDEEPALIPTLEQLSEIERDFEEWIEQREFMRFQNRLEVMWEQIDEGIFLNEEDENYQIASFAAGDDLELDDYQHRFNSIFPNFPISFEDDFLGQWYRDLTMEGIEPNPGPCVFESFCFECGKSNDFCCGLECEGKRCIVEDCLKKHFYIETPTEYGSIASSTDTLCYDSELQNLLESLSLLQPSINVDDKITELIEYYKDQISNLEFETQMKNMEIVSAKSYKERDRISNEVRRLIKIQEKKLHKLRENQRSVKQSFKTQMFPSFKVDLSENASTLLDELNSTLSDGLKIGFDQSTKELLSQINNTAEGFQKILVDFVGVKQNISKIFDLGVLILLSRVILGNECSITIKTMLTTVISIYMGAKYGYKPFRTQMHEGEFKSIINMISFLLHGILIATIPNTKSKFMKFMDFSSNYNKITENFEMTFSAILLYVEKLVNFFREQIFESEGLSLLESSDPDLSSWLTRAEAFVTNYQKGDKRVNIDKSIEVNNLKRQGYELEQKHGNMRNKSVVFGKFMYLLAYIKKISDIYEDLDFADHSARIVPIAACFRSNPGCGKTFPVIIMAQTLLAHSLPIEELLTFKKNPWVYMYASQGNLGYDDGMNGSEKVFIDSEWLQARQVPGVLTENHEFITDADSFPKLAHMAEAHKKGRIHKQPWFMLKCTNNMNYRDNMDDITDSGAVWRRFGRHIYYVGVREEYCTEETKNLDPWKRKIDYTKCPLEWQSVVQCYFRTDVQGNVLKELSFDDIIRDMLSDHEYQKQKHAAYIKVSDSRMNDIINKRMMKTQMDEGDEVKELFRKYNIPITMMKRFVTWLDTRNRTHDDLEIQICAFKDAEFDGPSCTSQDSTYLNDLFNSITESSLKISRNIEKIMEDYKGVFEAIKAIGLITTICGSIGGMLSMFKNEKHEVKQPNFTTENASPDGKTRGGKKSAKAKVRRAQRIMRLGPSEHKFGAEGGHDFGSHEMMLNVYRRNLYELFIPGKLSRSGFVLFLRNRVFIMPLHFSACIERGVKLGELTPQTSLVLRKCGTEVELKIPTSCFLTVVRSEYEGEDFCLCEASIDFPLHKDIISYFCRDQLYDKVFDKYGSLLCPGSNALFEKTNSSFDIVDDIGHSNDHDEYLNMLSIIYNIDTKVGDCGAPFFLRNASVGGGRLLGIHVSGTDAGHGMSVVVTQEQILDMIDKVDSVKVKNFDYDFVNQSDFPKYFAGVYPLGRHPSQVRNPTKTKIIPSVLSGIFGFPKTKPARLAVEYDSDGDISFDPFMKGLMKNVRDRPNVDLKILNVCEEHLFSTLVNTSKESSSIGKRTLTFEEAVLGISTIDYCDAIPRNTSSGYPYAMPGGLCEGKAGKTVFFGEGEQYDLNNQNCLDLKERVAFRMENLKKGIRNEVIFMDFAKDERRPIAKVDEGKTRMINACPLDHLIEVRQLFMSFAIWIQQNRIDNGICVGANPYSDEWHKLATMLKSKGPSVDAGDFSEFDYSELTPILWSILHIINKWYNNEDGNNLARETAWYEVVNSVHINGSYVYHLVSSLPSGHPLTVIINSMYVQLVFRYVWIMLHRNNVESIEMFNEHLYVASYGDDNVHNKSRYAESIMTEERLIELFKMIGLKYTNERKDDQVRKFRTLADVAFLKRSFRFDAAIMKYVAPLTLDTILEFVYWTKKGSQKEEITRQNVDNCLMELSLHDESTFNKYAPILLLNAQKELNYCPLIQSREYLLMKSRHIEEIW